jgi:hypothetical protein
MHGAIGLLFAIGVLLVFLGWRRHARRRRNQARLTRAARGEERARAWLEGRGFEILGAQVAAEYTLLVDDSAVPIGVRADYVVARRGVRYVAEVKTGALAPRVQTPATRRQLLEYSIAFDADGVLLVDAETGQVHEVAFPRPSKPERRTLEVALAIAVAVASIALLWRG